MIETVEGVGVGAGKSYYACTRIITHLAAGGTVCASETFGLVWEETKKLIEERFGKIIEDGQYETFPQSDIPRLHEVTPLGTPELPVLVVVDEAHCELNARDWADASKRPFFLWLTQSRHDDTDVMFISQAAANIDKQIGRLVTRVIRVRNLVGWSIPGIGKWPFKQFVVGTFDRDGKTLLDRKWISHDKGVFKCYTSKVMRGSHKRRGQIVPKRQLKKSAKKKPMVIKIFLFLIAGGVIWVASTWEKNPLVNFAKHGTMQAPPPKSEPLKNANAVASAGAITVKPKPKFTLIREDFRGQIDDEYLSTSGGVYEAGVMSAHGLVVGISRGVAKIITEYGETVYVVTAAARAPGVTGQAPTASASIENRGSKVEPMPGATVKKAQDAAPQQAHPQQAGVKVERFRTLREYPLRN
jgi:hypothetical protein